MTLKQLCLFPTGCDDIRAMLGAFEFVSSGRLQLGEIVRAEIRQCMALEPSPQNERPVCHSVQGLNAPALDILVEIATHISRRCALMCVNARFTSAQMALMTTIGSQNRLFSNRVIQISIRRQLENWNSLQSQ